MYMGDSNFMKDASEEERRQVAYQYLIGSAQEEIDDKIVEQVHLSATNFACNLNKALLLLSSSSLMFSYNWK